VIVHLGFPSPQTNLREIPTGNLGLLTESGIWFTRTLTQNLALGSI
jgi:hypothetical protein